MGTGGGWLISNLSMCNLKISFAQNSNTVYVSLYIKYTNWR